MRKSSKKRGVAGGNNASYSDGGQPICLIKRYTTITMSAGAGSLATDPTTLGTRATILSDGFALYRIVGMRYRLHPGTRSTTQVLAWYPGIVDTAPGSIIINSENPNSVVLATGQTSPTAWAKLSRKEVQGYFTWYKSKAGSLDPSEETQGTFYVNGTGAEQCLIEFEVQMQFRAPVDVSTTPAVRENAAVLRERDRLLRILSAGSTSTTPSSPGGYKASA